MEEIDRVPACVSTCPVGARHFGDLGDPNSAVSKLVVERTGFDLMAEMGYKPTNKYLPPRQRRNTAEKSKMPAELPANVGTENPILRWIDKALTR